MSNDPRKKLIANVTAAARMMLPLPYAWAAAASGPEERPSASRTFESRTACTS